MRIGLFFGTFAGGGAERMMINLAKGLSSCGNEVTIYVVNKTGVLLKEVPRSIPIHDYKAKYGARSIIHKIRDTLISHNLDALISTQEHVNASVALAKIGTKTNTIIIFREANTPNQKGYSWWRKYLYRKLYKKADHYVAVSKGVKEDLMEFYKLENESISVIYNPVVDQKMIDASKQEVTHCWLSNKDRTPVIIGMGRIHPQKGFEDLIEAFSLVQSKIKSKLIIFGSIDSEEYFKSLKRQVMDLNLDQDIEFAGFIDNPYKYLSKASVFVLSSKYEGLPGVLIQAMACGCPIVSTDCPYGPKEILNGDRYGKLVEVGNARMMADAIIETLNSPTDKAKVRERASIYSIDNSVSEYLNLIHSYKNDLTVHV
ncbi:MAG: glycosyltransferase [Balneolales bacterium]